MPPDDDYRDPVADAFADMGMLTLLGVLGGLAVAAGTLAILDRIAAYLGY